MVSFERLLDGAPLELVEIERAAFARRARARAGRASIATSSSLRQGLSTKSTAPCLSASTASVTLPYAVMSTTLSAGSITRSRASAFRPSRPLCYPSAKFMSSSTRSVEVSNH